MTDYDYLRNIEDEIKRVGDKQRKISAKSDLTSLLIITCFVLLILTWIAVWFVYSSAKNQSSPLIQPATIYDDSSLQELQKQIDELKEGLAKANKTIVNYEWTISELHKQVNELKGRINQTPVSASLDEKTLEDLNKQIKDLTEEMKKTNSKTEDIQKAYDRLVKGLCDAEVIKPTDKCREIIIEQ
ncbi:MAG TPA: hypothetical protein VJL89_08000 [Thermodesulfovibrionia bacterium]|nr:hypothetical protein [Thermodesulfovibrionia bacterium]